jgi:cardiolipin synthase
MYKFSWSDLATSNIVNWLCNAAEAENISSGKDIKLLLEYLFEHIGGPPITENKFDSETCERIAKGLLMEAFLYAYSEGLVGVESSGYILEKQNDGPLKSEIVTCPPVHLDWCKWEDLDRLPRFGKKLAQRTVLERRMNGPFKNRNDLATRIPGIGENTLDELEGSLIFRSNPKISRVSLEPEELIRTLVLSTGTSPEEGLVSILEYTVTLLANDRGQHWYTRQQYDKELPNTSHNCSWVGILRGSDYYYWLPSAFADAKNRIDIAMFHMAIPSEKHPTRILIEELIKAQKRGVKVSVLLDRDREEDPYKSEVININALNLLLSNNIAVKFDTEKQLLHSKLIIIDKHLAIIGSHNWSAGSYFRYDDISLVLESKSLVEELRSRFESIWGSIPLKAQRRKKSKK